MNCPECNVQQLQGITKPIKEGYLLKYKKRIFGKDWKENWVVLYEDSTMAWYKNKDKLEMPNGTIIVKEAPELLAVGQFTFRIPGTPQLPPGSSYYQLIAFGASVKDKVHWLLAASEDEANEWMSAISKTLPPAPFKNIEPAKIKIKNGQIILYNNEYVNIENIYATMKPALKKCKKCCTSCDYSSFYTKQNKLNSLPKCVNKLSKSQKTVCNCGTDLGTGILMGHAMAGVSTGWRGWGEGIGWEIAGGTNFNLTDNINYMQSHDLGEVDFENIINVAGVSHEATTIMDSTSELAGILSFDFLL